MSFALGGTPTGSPQHTQDAANIREQSATKVVARQDQMIVKDTIEVPLTKMAGDIWKYRQSETKAMMPMYLQVLLNRGDRTGPTWPQAFKELAQKLPDSLKALMQRELLKPQGNREESFEGLKKSLEFAAKGLDWLRGCKGVKVSINDEERKKAEKAKTQETLDFYKEIFQASLTVAEGLKPFCPEREYLLQMATKIPDIITAIGAKREKALLKRDFTQGDKAVAQEIDALRRYLKKNLGEKSPMIGLFLIDQLEVLHHLAFPNLNKRLFKMLWLQNKCSEVEFSLLHRMLGPLMNLSDEIAKRGAYQPIAVESSVYIGELLLSFLYVMERSEKKKDFTFFLSLTLLISSTFLETIGKGFMKALLIDDKSEEWIKNTILALTAGMMFYDLKMKKLHEKESEEVFEIFKGTFLLALSNTMSFLENREGEEEVLAVVLKLIRAIENSDSDEFIKEMERGFTKLGIKPTDVDKALKGLEELSELVSHDIAEADKEQHKLAFSARSA